MISVALEQKYTLVDFEPNDIGVGDTQEVALAQRLLVEVHGLVRKAAVEFAQLALYVSDSLEDDGLHFVGLLLVALLDHVEDLAAVHAEELQLVAQRG